ncbi:uncharacterized protein LOC122668798 [Telopea speciosissima]|uniref:uncharacterized protein LOC122668798 n=1 Tax=Telopea speciosissima TaxID=54955 RepID=UPI001CC39476|nr:uncharacterized protein LOC122668798 [Telopea speciosissima]
MTSPPSSPSHKASLSQILTHKLTPKNYVYWKTQIVPYLKGQRFYGHVDSSNPCPFYATKVDAWHEKDAPIMSIIISSLSDDAMPLAVGRDTSKEIWDALHAAFSSTSTTRILSLNVALQNLVQKPKETITQFLHRAKALSDELSAAGKPLPTEDSNIHIFRALCPKFESVVSAAMDRREPISYTELHGLLLSREYLIASRQAVSDPTVDAAANIAQPSRSPPSHPYGRGSSTGRGRGRGGRGAPTGPSGFGHSNAYAHSPCTIYGWTNHQAPMCYYRNKPPGQPTPPAFPPTH